MNALRHRPPSSWPRPRDIVAHTQTPAAPGADATAPVEADDLRLFLDLYAVIQPDGHGRATDLPPWVLLISCLRPTFPLLLFNVPLGDEAVVGARMCGGPLERLGWTTHVHTIRSYEKLTASGMTLSARRDQNRRRPAPAEPAGQSGHRPPDERAVADTFLRAIESTSAAGRTMGLFRRETGFLVVERSAPRVTGAGKILHLHRDRRAEPPGGLP